MRKRMIQQMLTLSTSAFGLVAALAWNEVIQEAVDQYIKPVLGKSSGVISQLIYAIVITIFAVAVTYNLTKLEREA